MRPTVYTGGTFDLTHYGHYRFLSRAAEIGDVTVALNTDEFIEQYKGKPPVLNYDARMEALLACRWVNKVIPNYGGANSKIAIELVNPDFIVIGSDWARKDYYAQMGFDQDWLDYNHIGLVYIPYTEGISTTEIKKRMGYK